MEIAVLQKKAERLAELRTKLTEIETTLIEPIKAERDALQEELLKDMATENVASLRVSGGDMYTRATRQGIQITNEVFAREWARENNAFSIDRRIVAQRLGKAETLPDGFERTETAYISIRKANDKGADNETTT